MKALPLARELVRYRSAASMEPRDDELFEIEGNAAAISERVTESVRSETKERYREWRVARNAALATLTRIEAIRRSLLDGTGSLMQDAVWREEIAKYRAKYNAHRQATATRLPMSLDRFESALTQQRARPAGMTPVRYRDILVGSEPVKQLAAAFRMPVPEVEKTLLPRQEDYLEWTFLARVISRFAVARRDGAEVCLRLLLDLIEALADNTCTAEFPRTKIQTNGSRSYNVSIFTLDIEELNALVDYVRVQTQGGVDNRAVSKVLTALEVVWHFPIPETERGWLGVDPRESIQRRLSG